MNNSLLHRYPNLVQLYARFEPGIVHLDRAATPVWYALGLFGNSLSTYVWLQPEVRKNNSSAIYLAALSIWDLLFLLLHTVQELKEAWNIAWENEVMCLVMPVLLLTAQYLSPLLVLGFTVERWLSICFPFKRESMCTPRRACGVVAAMIISVTLWNLWQLYFKYFSDGQCQLHTDGWFAYTLATEIAISGLVPCTALVFNILVVKELYKIAKGSKQQQQQQQQQQQEQQQQKQKQVSELSSMERRFRSTTITLLCVSFYVILTSLPAGLVYGLQIFAQYGSPNITDAAVPHDPQWQRHFAMTRVKKIIDEVSLSHYSLNFLIYLATGPQYRKLSKRLLMSLVSQLRAWCSCCCCCCSSCAAAAGAGAADGGEVDGERSVDLSSSSRRLQGRKLRQKEEALLQNQRTSRVSRRQAKRAIDDKLEPNHAHHDDAATVTEPLVTSSV